MKFSNLVILIIFVSLSAFKINDTFEMNNPSVKIISEEIDIKQAGDIIVFSVKLCSADNLKIFSITPSLKGQNEDSELKYIFNSNTKHATINYYYVVPENFKDNEELQFSFYLEDSSKKVVVEKNIFIE